MDAKGATKMDLDLSALPSGLYSLQAIGLQGEMHVRIVVKH